jgi:thioredoxin reductase (NADPH)
MFTGRRLLVIGGGDAAMEEAIGLTSYATEVVIVHRRDEFRASPIMVKYARSHDKISFLTPFIVEEILAGEQNTVAGARLRNLRTAETQVEPAGGVFVAIGHDPATELFRGAVELDDLGYVVVEPGSTRTSVEGVFAAGDVQDHTTARR